LASSADPDDEPKPEPEPSVSRDEARSAADTSSAEAADRLVGDSLPVVKTHSNVEQTLIEVTGDRARLVLDQAADDLSRRRDWGGPLGLVVGLGTCLLTAHFKRVLGVSPTAVRAVVVVAFVLAVAWLLRTVVVAVRAPTRDRAIERALEGLKHRESE
jgi:hypothetical protein